MNDVKKVIMCKAMDQKQQKHSAACEANSYFRFGQSCICAAISSELLCSIRDLPYNQSIQRCVASAGISSYA